MKDILSIFFSKEYEKEINKHLLEKDYKIPMSSILKYIRQLIEIPIEEYLDWLDTHFITTVIDKDDAPQYSKMEDASINIIHKLIEAGDQGFTNVQIGRFLQNDGKIRSIGTDTKYGENHAKTARYIGYLFSLDRYYYVSCIGYGCVELSEDEFNKLYCRLFIRTPLFRTVYLISKSEMIDMRDLFSMLADSTYKRRQGNIRFMFEMLKEEDFNWSVIYDKIIF